MRGSSKVPSRSAALLLLVLGALALLSCEDRADRTRSRAGVAIALETRYTAANTATSIANRADDPCGHFEIVGPITVVTDLVLEGIRDGEVALRLHELRTLEVDDGGQVRFLRQVEFIGEHGRTGNREHEWRILGGHVFYRQDNLPFEQRQIDISERATLVREGTAGFETLIRATGDGWSSVERTASGWRLIAAEDGTFGERLRCGGEATPDPWLRDLEGRLSVRSADARVTIGGDTPSSERAGEWLLGPVGGLEEPLIRVTVGERVILGQLTNPIETPEAIADLRRDRLHHDVSGFLWELDMLLNEEQESR